MENATGFDACILWADVPLLSDWRSSDATKLHNGSSKNQISTGTTVKNDVAKLLSVWWCGGLQFSEMILFLATTTPVAIKLFTSWSSIGNDSAYYIYICLTRKTFRLYLSDQYQCKEALTVCHDNGS